IAAYREAIRIKKDFAPAHCNLGSALIARRDLAGAIEALRQAIAVDPKLPQAHGGLGQALLEQGCFLEAAAATRRCLELLPPQPPQQKVAAHQRAGCGRLLALAEKLPRFPRGDQQPAGAAERIELAQFCSKYKRLNGAAARFYLEAFQAQPQ